MTPTPSAAYDGWMGIQSFDQDSSALTTAGAALRRTTSSQN